MISKKRKTRSQYPAHVKSVYIQVKNQMLFFFTVIPCILILSEFFIYQLIHKRVALKRILKFALKKLPHVLVESQSSGSILLELAKVTVTLASSISTVWLIDYFKNSKFNKLK
jgi:hypothetical protein